MKSVHININYIYISLVAYLFIPLFIFLLGWTNPLISIPIIAVTSLGIFFSIREIFGENKGIVCCNLTDLLIFFIGFFLFFVVAGHSDLFAQDYDWHKHHAIFNDLQNYQWPVVYENNTMLTYYLGQYITPSFIGKVFHSSTVMKWMIPVWNAIGLTIVHTVICFLLKIDTFSKKFLTFFLILLWGGLTNIGSAIYSSIHLDSFDIIAGDFKWIDLENFKIHFASNYDALHDAFQHVITPWLAVCFFMGNKNHYESYVMLSVPLMFSATFGFIYFAPILLVFALWNLRKSKFSKWIKSILSPGNLLMLPVAFVFLTYFYDYLLEEKPNNVSFGITDFSPNFDFYLIFIVVEFLAYSLLLFKKNIRNPLFYIINIELLIIPFFSLGMFNDLCSRGSIPARFILMILCLEFLFTESRKKWCFRGLVILLSLSIIFTGGQFCYHMYKTYKNWNDKEFLSDDFKTLEGLAGNPAIREDEAYNYYTFDYTNSLFYKIAKK